MIQQKAGTTGKVKGALTKRINLKVKERTALVDEASKL